MLYFDNNKPLQTAPVAPNTLTETPVAEPSQAKSTNLFSNLKDTALINILDAHVHYHVFRAVLDSASQNNFFSQSCYNRLKLPRFCLLLDIKGVGGVNSRVSQSLAVQ